jgi:hypothetical protein
MKSSDKIRASVIYTPEGNRTPIARMKTWCPSR